MLVILFGGGVAGTCHRGRVDGVEGLAERTRHAARLMSDRPHWRPSAGLCRADVMSFG